MSFLSRSLLIAGSILLAHACYSAQEFSALLDSKLANPPPIASAAADAANPYPTLAAPSALSFSTLPLDIILETIISVALLCVGIVLGSDALKPISWRVWAGKVEREKDQRKEIGKVSDEGFLWLEPGRRRGFIDIRAERQDFANWVRGQGN